MIENLEAIKADIHKDYVYFSKMEFTHLATKFKRDYDTVCQLEEELKKRSTEAPAVICL